MNLRGHIQTIAREKGRKKRRKEGKSLQFRELLGIPFPFAFTLSESTGGSPQGLFLSFPPYCLPITHLCHRLSAQHKGCQPHRLHSTMGILVKTKVIETGLIPFTFKRLPWTLHCTGKSSPQQPLSSWFPILAHGSCPHLPNPPCS
jgi:hypothetical protein